MGSLDGKTCRFMPNDIDASLVTHINYGFVVMDRNFEITKFVIYEKNS
jgi:GH18 family chitinase